MWTGFVRTSPPALRGEIESTRSGSLPLIARMGIEERCGGEAVPHDDPTRLHIDSIAQERRADAVANPMECRIAFLVGPSLLEDPLHVSADPMDVQGSSLPGAEDPMLGA